MEDKLINSWHELSEQANWGELDELLIPQDSYMGKDFYIANTNGNDVYYQLYIFADKNTVYWGEAILTQDDLIRDGNDANPEWDEYMYKYKDFSFELNDFKKWLKEKIQQGISQGHRVYNSFDVFEILKPGQCELFDNNKLIWKMNIPDYALSYLVNGDASGLEDGEQEELDDWYKQMRVISIEPTNKHNEFDNNPEFGLPCATTECKVITKDSSGR